MRFGILLGILVLAASWPAFCAAEESKAGALLATIKKAGREGQGNEEAAKAWRELVRLGPDVLMDILTALDDADARAANWLRPAVEAIAERELNAKRKLPADKLEEFVLDTRHAGSARRLAYEWLVKADSSAPSRLLPGMLNDPAAELRRDAVALALEKAQKLTDKKEKANALRHLFDAARDRDQVDLLAKELQKLEVTVDVNAHFGFINEWLLAGPFDNSGGSGFKKAYPPEKSVDPAATYEGKKEAKIAWKPHKTADVYGMVDLNKALSKQSGVIAYAFAVVTSSEKRPIEIRAGSNNAVKIFLNGEQVFFREEYHHGMRMDQHVGTGTLKPGRNEILLKVCQNEQKEDWAQLWSFQLRVCDALGGALPVKVALAKLPGNKEKTQP